MRMRVVIHCRIRTYVTTACLQRAHTTCRKRESVRAGGRVLRGTYERTRAVDNIERVVRREAVPRDQRRTEDRGRRITRTDYRVVYVPRGCGTGSCEGRDVQRRTEGMVGCGMGWDGRVRDDRCVRVRPGASVRASESESYGIDETARVSVVGVRVCVM
ncbi:hypothetical protein OH77DRAFT_1095713 [Trametes cingulata]|nr:hypothetical protein OH77DRAFT_1095713 [Trametes cingulata]